MSSLHSVKDRKRLDFSHIPGRSRAPENQRSVAKREKDAAEAAAKMDRARIDWTETNEFGHIVMSHNTRCLELSSVPDYGGESKCGPIYPRGAMLEGLNLVVENIENANSTTFNLLKPRKKADYNPDESKRYALAEGAHKAKAFELVEPLEEVVAVNSLTGVIDKPHLHMNAVALPDEDVFKIGRAILHSRDVELIDLYSNFITESPATFLADGICNATGENVFIKYLKREGLPSLAPSLTHRNTQPSTRPQRRGEIKTSKRYLFPVQCRVLRSTPPYQKACGVYRP